MPSHLEWHGREILQLIEAAGHRGVVKGIKAIAETSQERVLVQTGELKRSQRRQTKGLQGVVGYTDSKAVGAHENLTVTPRNGKQAKFLESAAHDRGDDVLALIAEEIRKVL